jgi:hypothetical protein
MFLSILAVLDFALKCPLLNLATFTLGSLCSFPLSASLGLSNTPGAVSARLYQPGAAVTAPSADQRAVPYRPTPAVRGRHGILRQAAIAEATGDPTTPPGIQPTHLSRTT